MIKKCSRCKRKKSLALFSKNKNNKDGHQSACKNCCAKESSKNASGKAVRRICNGINCRGTKTFWSYGRRYCKSCRLSMENIGDTYTDRIFFQTRTSRRIA